MVVIENRHLLMLNNTLQCANSKAKMSVNNRFMREEMLKCVNSEWKLKVWLNSDKFVYFQFRKPKRKTEMSSLSTLKRWRVLRVLKVSFIVFIEVEIHFRIWLPSNVPFEVLLRCSAGYNVQKGTVYRISLMFGPRNYHWFFGQKTN